MARIRIESLERPADEELSRGEAGQVTGAGYLPFGWSNLPLFNNYYSFPAPYVYPVYPYYPPVYPVYGGPGFYGGYGGGFNRPVNAIGGGGVGRGPAISHSIRTR
jgi:hypothetical protein